MFVVRTSSGHWIGRHPGICAAVFAVAIGLGPAAQLANGASVAKWVVATIAVVAGAGFGWLFALIARRRAPRP